MGVRLQLYWAESGARRREPCQLSEKHPSKMTLIGKAGKFGDLGEWKLRIRQQGFGSFDPLFLQPTIRRHAHGAGEHKMESVVH
jgi:hypothetical protein